MIARFLSRLARTPTPTPAPAVPPAPSAPAAAAGEVGFPPGALDEWRPSWAVMGTSDVGMRAWQSDHVWRPLRVDGQTR